MNHNCFADREKEATKKKNEIVLYANEISKKKICFSISSLEPEWPYDGHRSGEILSNGGVGVRG